MIARLLVGGIVVYPLVYARPPLTPRELAACAVLALVVALFVPDDWHD